jgi:Uncharacterized conserved protein
MPRHIRLLAVGRLRAPHWKAAAAHYEERLKHWVHFRHDCVADGDAALPPDMRNTEECARLRDALSSNNTLICLDERGKTHTSRQFAALLERLCEDANRSPCFVIGGAFGLTDTFKQEARHCISLGPLTLPHELARVVLLEQLYRAESIIRKLPYHHD